MKILFISNELIGSGLCHRLIREGNDVKLYIHDESRKACFDGFVKKIDDWKKELRWVGKDGLIIFDDVGFGAIQDNLRKRGYSVFGGNVESDRLELDRAHAQRILHNYGVKVLPSFNFKTVDSAIEFVKENKGKWVVKQSSHISVYNHVGERSDGKDVIEVLKKYKELGIETTHLQKRVTGVEVGVARYFNGHDWVGPIEINHEHKRLYNGDVGPLTPEMGTVMWHSTDESMPLFAKTLKKIKPYLRKIKFKGDIDINCIISKDLIWPLEFTTRLGSPAVQLQCELYESSMTEFIDAVARGKKIKLKHKDQFGISLTLGLPNFPYPPEKDFKKPNVLFTFNRDLTPKEEESVHFEEISVRYNKKGEREFYWSGEFGYVAFLSASADTILETRAKIRKLLSAVHMPNMIYRTDIGFRVYKTDLPKLKTWGWV
jgi:phosphoribosylamine--glycine ligase